MGSGGESQIKAVGYNKGEIENIRNAINDQAQETAKVIVREINQLVEHSSKLWYSEVAQEYFKTFASNVSEYEDKITQIFQQFNQLIADAGASWAERTEGEAPNMPEIEKVSLEIDVSPIQATNEHGDRYIEDGIEEEVSFHVSTAKTAIKFFVDDVADRANLSLAFIGGDQSDGIKQAAKNLTGAVDSMLDFLTEGDNALVNKVKEYRESYQDTAAKNVETFTDSAFTDIQ